MSNRSSFCHGVVFFNLLKTHRTTILLLPVNVHGSLISCLFYLGISKNLFTEKGLWYLSMRV